MFSHCFAKQGELNVLDEQGNSIAALNYGHFSGMPYTSHYRLDPGHEAVVGTFQIGLTRGDQQTTPPIANFQVTRHKIADMATEIEAARQLVYNTIRLHVEQEDCQAEVAMCKLYACEMATRVINEAIQIFGGYGYMMEYPVQRMWRDARINTIGGGTSEIQREIIGRLMLR